MVKRESKQTPQLLRFFCESGDIWFQFGSLIASLIGVILALAQINKLLVKVIVIILLLLLFVLTLLVIRAKFRAYKIKSATGATPSVSGNIVTNVTNHKTTYSNNTINNFFGPPNTKTKRINITSIAITLIIAVSVTFLVVFILLYGGSKSDDPKPTPRATTTPTMMVTPTPANSDRIVASARLTDLTPLTNDGVDIYPDEVIDNVGDEHYHRIFGVSGSEIKYYLRGDYKTLSGVWYVCYRDRETSVSSSCKIYADGDLVYTSPSIKGGDVPEEFSINIDYCEYLEVHFISGNGEAELGDLKLES